MPLLRCDNLSVGYARHTVASGISFSVGSGDCVAVVGANGSGKTTLLRTLANIMKPLGGTFSYDPSVRPGDVGYLPQQNPVQRDFPATAREVVLSGCQARRGLRPFFTKSEKSAADAALERFGAASFAGLSYKTLSGGQRQRVLLARALCAGRKMLILDEPVTGLDPDAAADLYSTLAALRGEGLAIVSVTHDLPAGVEDATHILELSGAVFFGTKEKWMDGRSGVCSVCGDCVSGSHHHHGAGCRHACAGKGAQA